MFLVSGKIFIINKENEMELLLFILQIFLLYKIIELITVYRSYTKTLRLLNTILKEDKNDVYSD